MGSSSCSKLCRWECTNGILPFGKRLRYHAYVPTLTTAVPSFTQGLIIQVADMITVQLFHISVAIYALIVIPLKVSLILQIRRIFMPHDRSIRERPTSLWIIDGFLALNVMFYVALFLFQFLACRPLAHAWNPLVPGTCVADKLVVHIVSASINTASDLIIITMPQPVIWSLTLSKKRKWGLSAVFLLGGL